MTLPNILIRADGYAALGGGHVMRCLTLADALADQGAHVALMLNSEAANIVPLLAQSSHQLLYVDDTAASENGLNATLAAIAKHGVRPLDAIVTDLYAWDKTQETALRGFGKRIVVIDDLANRPHDCDLLIDQTYGREGNVYAPLVASGSALALGAKFALLRPDFTTARALIEQGQTDIKRQHGRVLVSLGLTDVGGISGQVVEKIRPNQNLSHIDVVIAAHAPSMPLLLKAQAQDSRIHLHHNIAGAQMTQLMQQASFAIGAAGTTTWERCCLGLATLSFVLADNQKDIAHILSAAGAIQVSDLDSLATDVQALLDDPTKCAAMAQAAATIVDGHGSTRIAQRILRLISSTDMGKEIFVRPAMAQDCQPLFNWRNDPRARAVSANQEPLVFDDHAQWFAATLRNPNRILLMGEDIGGGLIGMTRFDRRMGESAGDQSMAYDVSINLAPNARGKGYGKALLGAAIAHLGQGENIGHLYAQARADNMASVRIFEQNGFEIAPPIDGWVQMMRLI